MEDQRPRGDFARNWLPHLWALVIPLALVVLAYVVGLFFLYSPALPDWIFGVRR